VHICFGYAAIIHQRPSGYSFLGQLKSCSCSQVSFETAQSKLDCSIVTELKGKKLMLGVIDLSDTAVETPETVAARIRRVLPYAPAADIIVAPDCGMKYLPREIAFAKMKALADGAAMVRREIGGG
jgi:5-methyltetrahydropteroyltriglutamate--homocysteine methyltransferase